MGMREKLIAVMQDTRANAAWHRWNYEESADYMIKCGVTIPVRCKECRYYDDTEGLQWCHLNSKFGKFAMDWHSFPEDGFCSYGERKGDVNDD